jgi:hypothetical protein
MPLVGGDRPRPCRAITPAAHPQQGAAPSRRPAEEIIAVMRQTADDGHGARLRTLIVVRSRGGLRVQQALALGERDPRPAARVAARGPPWPCLLAGHRAPAPARVCAVEQLGGEARGRDQRDDRDGHQRRAARTPPDGTADSARRRMLRHGPGAAFAGAARGAVRLARAGPRR